MASTTTLPPASSPRPIWMRFTASSTSIPRPRAPIIEQVTTMAMAIISVWFTPVIIVGSACGICTFHKVCHRVEPKEWAASTTSLSTCCMPRLVRRTTGTMA